MAKRFSISLQKHYVLPGLFLVIVITATARNLMMAGTPNNQINQHSDNKKSQIEGQEASDKPSKEDRHQGGTFKVNLPENIRTLYPPAITNVYSRRVTNQVYEGLLKFNQKDLSLEPCLAKSYEVDSTQTIYTFHLKKGIKFHRDTCFSGEEGRELTAHDVQYCFKQLCTHHSNNQNFYLVNNISGANKYYQATRENKNPDMDINGIRILDKYTVQFKVNAPDNTFLYHLAHPATFIYPQQAYEAYGSDMQSRAVGTGPFKISSIQEDTAIILSRNEEYHSTDEYGNKLPFLDTVRINFIKNEKEEYFEFKKGNLDMIYRIPLVYFTEELEKSKGIDSYYIQRIPEMATKMLTFNQQDTLYKNKALRKALSFAIDRKRIVNDVLNGQANAPGYHGITPPIFEGYDTKDINGYRFNVDSAQYYLKQAGYPNGKGLPELTLGLNTFVKRSIRSAVEIKDQLDKHLNVNIKLDIESMSSHDKFIPSGKFGLFTTGWAADYPHPENFLRFFSSNKVPDSTHKHSYLNVARYCNPEFDSLYQKALKASSRKRTYELFMRAEQVAMDNVPVIVLWYEEGYRLVKEKVKNFPVNPMQYWDFSKVYFKQPD